MNQISRFVIWICKRFNREQIISIVEELSLVISDKHPELKPKDSFREEHPKYRDYSADPLAPLDYAKFTRPKKN